MKFLIKLLKKPIKKLVKREMEKDAIKEQILVYMNEKIDLPKLTESEEQRLFASIYDAALEAACIAIDRI